MTFLFFWQPLSTGTNPVPPTPHETAPPDIGAGGVRNPWHEKQAKLRARQQDEEELLLFVKAAVQQIAADFMNRQAQR